MTTDKRVDAYIAKSPAFAQPILAEVRARVRKAFPAVEETIKWNVPFWLLDGEPLASMAGFKHHAKIAVWGAAWREQQPDTVDVSSVGELPPVKTFAAQLDAAAKRIRARVTSPPAKKTTAKKTTAKKKTATTKK